MKLAQISMLLSTILLGVVNSVTIFQGFSIKKGFDISLIPFPIKPITFIKEKWSPFGSFGVKHEIARRQVVNIVEPEVIVTPVPVLPPAYVVPAVPRPAHPPVAPVVEHHDESEIVNENIEKVPPEIPLITPPVVPVEDKVSETPLPAVVEEPVVVISTEAPSVIITPVPPIPIQAPPIALVPTHLPNNLNTDISRATAINNYLNTVEKPAPPTVSQVQEVKETIPPSLFSSFLPRDGMRNGSKLALQLGSAFLHFMTQVFSSPRSPFA